ncbi:MAG: 4-hydroxy-tetrahydrodipicolinate reductase [Candidatus Omnitrophica bacterium]|nr:4-hydroxy-tetrahydrodipicolinate reductase [Candidatus Omnitrophota bacterium]
MIKLAVSGCYGRMGQRITHFALQDKEFKLSALLERPDHPQNSQLLEGLPVVTDANKLAGSDVLIEFTTPEATLKNLEICRKHKVRMVIGTTGLDPQQIEQIHQASEDVAIVFSSNMSVGVNILFKLTEILSKTAPANYTVSIREAHHIHKKDSPSGTAKTLAEFVETNSTHKVKNIEAIREGEIIGDHDVIFESEEDVIVLRHHAKTRDIFAKGSLVAAKFLATKNKGLFHMQDVLGLR